MLEPMKRLEMHINDNNKWDEFWSYKIELGQDREISKFNYDIWPKLSKNFEFMKGLSEICPSGPNTKGSWISSEILVQYRAVCNIIRNTHPHPKKEVIKQPMNRRLRCPNSSIYTTCIIVNLDSYWESFISKFSVRKSLLHTDIFTASTSKDIAHN